jgi:hypothetical protein
MSSYKRTFLVILLSVILLTIRQLSFSVFRTQIASQLLTAEWAVDTAQDPLGTKDEVPMPNGKRKERTVYHHKTNSTNKSSSVTDKRSISHSQMTDLQSNRTSHMVKQVSNYTSTASIQHSTPSTPTISDTSPNESFCQDLAQWIDQPRIANSPLDVETARVAIEPNPIAKIDSLLGETFCHEQGRFRTTSSEARNASNTDLVKEWELKLIYLAIHEFHHLPARQEYQQRKSCTGSISDVPPYDYQCADTKYLVTNIPDIGLGAGIRLSAMAHVLMAIASDRIPLFLANTPEGPETLQNPWKLASCDRQDMQCVFQPTTPCVLLASDLVNATVLDEVDARSLRRGGVLPSKFDNDKVLIAQPRISPAKFDQFKGIHGKVRKKLHEKAMALIDEWKSSSSDDLDPQQLHVLEEAARRIRHADEPDSYDHYTYGHRYYRIPHAIVMYLLRPNLVAKQKMKEQLERIMPPVPDAQYTLGMPIRGSDKCKSESTCLKFDKYMMLAKETWHAEETNDQPRGTLIMTTEDESLFQQRLLFTEQSNFPLDFVVNDQDSFQGSGNANVFGEDADNIMLSSLIAIQMHFYAGHVFGNCCSNFHLMLFDFLREGCGLTTQATCLQETKDYNVCCAWTRTEECEVIKAEYRIEHESAKEKRIREAPVILKQVFANYTGAGTNTTGRL